MAVITKGIQLWVKESENGVEIKPSDTVDNKLGCLVPDLQEIGDLVGAVGAERDKIEVTTLADDKHVYVDGLIAEADNDSIEFKLLYSPKCFKAFATALETEVFPFYLTIPNGVEDRAVFTIMAKPSIKVDGAGVNSAITMTLTLTPTEVIDFKESVSQLA